MPAEFEPPELARLVDVAERPREGDWSLRSALVRYAQAEPERVRRVLEQVRRLDAGLRPHTRLLVRRGPELWAALEAGEVPTEQPDALVVGLLDAARELDRLGDRLAEWATDRAGPRPDGEVDAAVAVVERRLDTLGVPREEGQGRPPRARSRG